MAAVVLPVSDSSVVGRHLFKTHLLKWFCVSAPVQIHMHNSEPRATEHVNNCILICGLIFIVSHHQHPAVPQRSCNLSLQTDSSDLTSQGCVSWDHISLCQRHTLHISNDNIIWIYPLLVSAEKQAGLILTSFHHCWSMCWWLDDIVGISMNAVLAFLIQFIINNITRNE